MQSLAGHDRVDDLIRASRTWDKNEPVQLDFDGLRTIYPNGAVPFAATINHLRGQGFSIHSTNLRPAHAKVHAVNPMTIDKFVRYETPLTHNVWAYRDETEAQQLATKFMEALTDQVACEAGVIDALNWCLYEVLDNVFQHSGASEGFVMMQLHARERKCAIAVSDTGIGIQRSLMNATTSAHVDLERVRQAHLAIEHAAQAGVTSKGKLNQGNGLHGLRRSVEINGGRLAIRSGRGLWAISAGITTANTDLTRPVVDAESHQSTTVDWQLDCGSPVSINDALGTTNQGGELLESIEVGPGHYRVNAAEIEASIGSRVKGSEIRVRINNYLAAGAEQIVIDLSQVGVVSSSFADEVLGKLASEMGELAFRRRIFVDGASPTNRSLIERAIELRLATGL